MWREKRSKKGTGKSSELCVIKRNAEEGTVKGRRREGGGLWSKEGQETRKGKGRIYKRKGRR